MKQQKKGLTKYCLGEEIEIKRIATENFEQQLEVFDIRTLPRVFEETATHLVESNLFFELLRKIATYAQNVTPHIDIKQLKISAHFMSVKARKAIPGNKFYSICFGD